MKSHISHEHVENIWRYLGLAGVLANLPIPSLGGLLRPLALHRQPAETKVMGPPPTEIARAKQQ